jgi:two-component system OmpR family response regulator
MLSHGESVLVVEDDESLAQVIAIALRAEGFEAQTAHDGIDGYTSYFNHPTEWVVTDIQMPELDGIGMMQCIRTINPRVRAIYMSGAVEEYRVPLERETKQFAARVLHKPFSRDRLLEQLTAQTKDGSLEEPKTSPAKFPGGQE